MRRLVFISQGIHDTPKVFEKDLDQESPYNLVEQAREKGKNTTHYQRSQDQQH